MVVTAITVFFASLAGIVGLFSLKLWEEGRDHSLMPRMRSSIDAIAVHSKGMLLRSEEALSKVPSLSAYLALKALALGAVAFAKSARGAAEAAHRLADFVSHKHNFERRETRSDFLKQVSAYPRNTGTADVNILTTPTSVSPLEIKTKRRKPVRDIDVRR